MLNIHFEKATLAHKNTIFEWLAESHMQEFWDNSQDHKDDIVNFINERKQNYFYGTTKYWIGFIDNQPFCFLLTDKVCTDQDDLSELHRAHLSKIGHTIALDFGIGNKEFLGKGLAAPTLIAFTSFYQEKIDPKADTFFIDPDENNPRAKHVYEKAGFEIVGSYEVFRGTFKDSLSYLMVKMLPLKPKLIKATLLDYPTIQNMARFYVYEMSRFCGWTCPEDGLYESFDFKCYFEEKDRHAFLLKVGDELAGFALTHKKDTTPESPWNMGEFFILAKFQGQSIGQQVTCLVWDQFPGVWEVSVIPENKGPLIFWRKTISQYTNGHFVEKVKTVDYDIENSKRIIFSFSAENKSKSDRK